MTILLVASSLSALADFAKPWEGGQNLRPFTGVHPSHGHPTADHPAPRLIQKSALELPFLRGLVVPGFCCVVCYLEGEDCYCTSETPCDHIGCVVCGYTGGCCDACPTGMDCECSMELFCYHAGCTVCQYCCVACEEAEGACVCSMDDPCEHFGCNMCQEPSICCDACAEAGEPDCFCFVGEPCGHDDCLTCHYPD